MSVERPDRVVVPATVFGIAPHVDRELLVVPSGCRLPQRCIKTNRPVEERDMIRAGVYWFSPWYMLVFLLSGPLFLFAYMFARRKCVITYGLDPAIRKKMWRRTAMKWLAAIVFLGAAIVVWDTTQFQGAIAVACLVLFALAAAMILLGNSPLRVSRYREGVFWLEGCPPEYLSSLRFD